MNKITGGIPQPNLPFKLDKYIGTLLYQEFPVTAIYVNERNNPVVREWVDCDEDIHRFYYYEVSKSILQLFINGGISHFDLFYSALNSFGFIVDEENINSKSITLITPDHLPQDYLPSYDVFFNASEGVDTNKIIEFFNLQNENNSEKELDNYLKFLAKDRKSEIFNLHYKKGNGVGYGRIETQVFGKTIIAFDDLYKEIALDHFYGKERGDSNNNKQNLKEKNEKLKIVSTEFFLKKAASFSAYIKPKYNSQYDLFGQTDTEIIATNLFTLFADSETKEIFTENFDKYSDFSIKAYKLFLKEAIHYDVNLQLNWTDISTEKLLKKDFSLFIANNVINFIDELNTQNISSFKKKGNFTAINCKTAHFSFVSNNGEEYTGYFEKEVRELIYFLNFTTLYEVTLERKVIKEAGNNNDKVIDKISAYYEIKE